MFENTFPKTLFQISILLLDEPTASAWGAGSIDPKSFKTHAILPDTSLPDFHDSINFIRYEL